jgi:hypothetical protein
MRHGGCFCHIRVSERGRSIARRRAAPVLIGSLSLLRGGAPERQVLDHRSSRRKRANQVVLRRRNKSSIAREAVDRARHLAERGPHPSRD